jgi:hypothetical protein
MAESLTLAAGLADAFDRLGTPDVLADGHAQADAAEIDRPGHRSRREHPLLVEHAVVRQIDLEAQAGDTAAVEQRHGIVELAVFDPGGADQHRGPAIRRVGGERLDRAAARLLERRLENEVLGRIAADEQLGEHDEISAVARRLGAGAARLVRIARDVADDRVELGDGERKAIRRTRVHGSDLAATPPPGNRVWEGSRQPTCTRWRRGLIPTQDLSLRHCAATRQR